MIELLNLNKTWLIDFDGTIIQHNAELFKAGEEILLPGVKDFFVSLDPNDVIILTTARSSSFAFEIKKFLQLVGLKVHDIIFNLPVGPRIVINDRKPDGSKTAHAVNLKRNEGFLGMEIE